MVGSSNDSSLVVIATLMLKDSAGMIASLAFSYFAAHHFDDETRFWRLFADVINDIGLTLELAAPLFGPYFLTVTVFANVCKALCGVAAGATRTAVSAHFALSGNVAEVQAKEGVQETFVTLAGMYAGVRLVQWLVEGGQDPVDAPASGGLPDAAVATHSLAWMAFMALTLIHVLVNWYGMRLLSLRTLNRSRLYALVRHWILGSTMGSTGSVLSPTDMASLDPLMLPPSYGGKVVRTAYRLLPGPLKLQVEATLPPGDVLASALSSCYRHLYFNSNPYVEPLDFNGQATIAQSKELARTASCRGAYSCPFTYLFLRAPGGSWRVIPTGQMADGSSVNTGYASTPTRARGRTQRGGSTRKASPHRSVAAQSRAAAHTPAPAPSSLSGDGAALHCSIPPGALTGSGLDACLLTWAPARATGSCHTTVYVAPLPGCSSLTSTLAYTVSLCLLAPGGGQMALAVAQTGQLHTLMEVDTKQGARMLEEASKAGWNTGMGLIGSSTSQAVHVVEHLL